MSHVNEYVQWFKNKRQGSVRSATKYRNILDLWDAFLAECEVSYIEADAEVVELFTGRERRTGKGPAPATVQNELSILSEFYTWGMARYDWPSNPTLLAAKPRVRNRQPRPVEDELWLSFWLADLPDLVRVITGLGYYCGLRREELCTLTGGHVWRGALRNFVRKNGGEDVFPYAEVVAHFDHFLPDLQAGLLLDPLESLARSRGAARLVPWESRRPEALNKALYRWLRDAELPYNAFGPHQLRHSFATQLLGSGVDIAVVCELMNHSSPTITWRYVRVSGSNRLAAMRGNTEARKDGTHAS